MASVVSASKTYVGSRSGTRSSASLNAGTSMSESMPNRSRTLAILSGDAITVSLRLSGFTLGRSVMMGALRQGRRCLNKGRNKLGSLDLGREREERRETLGKRDV